MVTILIRQCLIIFFVWFMIKKIPKESITLNMYVQWLDINKTLEDELYDFNPDSTFN